MTVGSVSDRAGSGLAELWEFSTVTDVSEFCSDEEAVDGEAWIIGDST